jgi:acetyltransferase-like isoleucine patch superfamily enzyme
MGSNVIIHKLAQILAPERLILGDHVIIDDFAFLGRHEKLILGNYVHIASHASITGGGKCLVSDFVNISSGARILTGSDDFAGGGLAGPAIPANYRNVTRSRVIIGAHALVGANAVVLPGITIGEGASIGAGSVVTKDLPPWAIYAGQPARHLRPRPKDKIVELTHDLFKDRGTPQHRYLDGLELDSE